MAATGAVETAAAARGVARMGAEDTAAGVILAATRAAAGLAVALAMVAVAQCNTQYSRNRTHLRAVSSSRLRLAGDMEPPRLRKHTGCSTILVAAVETEAAKAVALVAVEAEAAKAVALVVRAEALAAVCNTLRSRNRGLQTGCM